jgi:anti-sigma B factor antagonist
MGRTVHEAIKPNVGFDFARESRGNVPMFRCRGAFSLGSYANLNDLTAAIHDSTGARIVLDLSEISHIDSAGIGTLATIFKDCRTAGRDLRIVPSTPVRLALGLVKIDKLLRLCDSVDAALAE